MKSNQNQFLMKNAHLTFLTFLILFSSCKIENQSMPSTQKEPDKKTFTKLNLENPDISRVLETQSRLGEGAIWNYQTGELFFIDIEGKKWHAFNPSMDEFQTYDLRNRIGTIVPTKDDKKVILALDDGIYEFNRLTNAMQLIADPEPNRPEMRMNDGKCDPAGRFWVGSMHLEQITGAASLYKIEGNGDFEKMIPEVTISNGIAWSLDTKKMYYIDTPTGMVKEYDFDEKTGKISFVKNAIEIPESLGYPDGMTIDAEGMLWIALWNGNSVTRWNPNTGKLMNQVKIPAHNVSSCAFGGEDLGTLYVTSARVDMTEEELESMPESGDVFAFRPGVKGVKSFFYKNEN